MSKLRFIDPKITLSETVALLNYRQRDLWTRLILTVDDQGRCPGNPALIRSSIFPLDDIDIPTIESDLKVLEEYKFIIVYVVGGRRYIQLRNWQKYQRRSEWLGESDYPAPEGWEDRFRVHGKGRLIVKSDNWDIQSQSSDCMYEQTSHLPLDLDAQTSSLPINLNAQTSPLPIEDINGNGNGNDNDDINDDEKGKEEDKPIKNVPIIEQHHSDALTPPTEEQMKIWELAKGKLQEDGINAAEYSAYIEKLNLISVEDDKFVVKSSNHINAERVRSRYAKNLNTHIQGFVGKQTELVVTHSKVGE